jgi:hypothetical protein
LDKHITSVHENKKPNFDCISSVHEEKRPDSGSDIFLFSSSSDSDVGLESDPFLKQKKQKKKTNNPTPSKQIKLFNTNDHCKPVHEGKKQLICKTCSASFSLKLDLDKHIASVHEDKKPNFDRHIESVNKETKVQMVRQMKIM